MGSTLYKYFENDGSQNELAMLQKIGKKDFAIDDNELATELFGKSMYISASKTEKFYKCPFGYFCEYGTHGYVVFMQIYTIIAKMIQF